MFYNIMGGEGEGKGCLETYFIMVAMGKLLQSRGSAWGYAPQGNIDLFLILLHQF